MLETEPLAVPIKPLWPPFGRPNERVFFCPYPISGQVKFKRRILASVSVLEKAMTDNTVVFI